jgi:hypothetical protein
MNGFTRARWRIVGSSAVWFGLIAVGAGFYGFAEADAAPIHKARARLEAEEAWLERSSGSRAWSHYLLAGPRLWSSVVHPQLTPAVDSAIWKALRTDRTEQNPWIHFLLYKQSLNPARFDRYHPNVAIALRRISASPVSARVLTPATTPSSTPSTGTDTPLVEGQQIPEPAAWLLAVGMAGWGAWWRHRRR